MIREMTVHLAASDAYRHRLKAVRLSRIEREEASRLQRSGRTLREISQQMGVPLNVVQQSLYWDEVAK